MNILQLNPPIPMTSEKGDCLAILAIDYGPEYNIMWTVIIDETQEIWTLANPKLRGQKNISMGRFNKGSFVEKKSK